MAVVMTMLVVVMVVVMRVTVIVSLMPMVMLSVGVIVVMLMTVVMVRMPVIVMVVGVLVMRVLVFLLCLFLNNLVGFEQANAQQQGQGDIAFDRMQETSIGFDLTEHPFQLFEPFWGNQITFVQHQDVAVEHLSPAHLGIEDLFAKVLGINQGDDRIQARFIAQITAEKRHRHR